MGQCDRSPWLVRMGCELHNGLTNSHHVLSSMYVYINPCTLSLFYCMQIEAVFLVIGIARQRLTRLRA